MIKTTGKNKNYELIEYISDVNTRYTQVLMELNENGAMDAAYTYGVSRLTEDRFTGESNFYLYDPAGNVAGITDQDGYLWQSYRYDAFGNATFGSPQYDNEYTFNGESYNPNIHSQYLRARYYDTVKGSFLTEDSYLGDISNPLTLNRYSYCIGNPLYYSDPSGYAPRTPSSNPASPYNRIDFEAREKGMTDALQGHQDRVNEVIDNIYDWLGEDDRSSAEQFVDGFITGFAGSFYATYDSITNPESVLALACNILNHPFKTLAGIAKNAFVGNSEQVLYYIKTKNYRALGQDMGYTAGKIAQVAIARAAIKKCGELSNEKGGETPSPGGETPLPQSINEEGVNVNPQSPMFGEDWHRYFNEAYGKESVTWETASIQDIIDMPSKITDFSPTQIADLAQANGWSVGPLGKGSLAGIPYEQGGGFSMHAPNGGSEYIQYHPGGGHHGELPYFKVSSGRNGIKRFFMGENQ